MKINFIISKIANEFFFISNLSEWHFSCRKDYNSRWLEKTGKLKPGEKKVLGSFGAILKKNSFSYKNEKSFKAGGSKFLGNFFYKYNEEKVWKVLRSNISTKNVEEIKKVFEVFNPRFQKIWEIEKKTSRLRILKELIGRTNYREAFRGIEVFFGEKVRIKKINVVVLISPLGWQETASGSANIGNSHITLELPALKKNTWQLDFSAGIAAHEIGHILYRTSPSIDLVNKILKNKKAPHNTLSNIFPKRSLKEVVDETIVSSLMPSGYLAEKFFKFKPTEIHFSDSNLKTLGKAYNNLVRGKPVSANRIIKLFTWQLYPLVSSYINSRKAIDSDFIQQVLEKISIIYKKGPISL